RSCSVLSLSPLRLPPTSPLVPYTTLFRSFSDRTVTSEEFLTDELGLKGLGIISEINEADIRRKIAPKLRAPMSDDDDQSRMRRRDRKSTRLNSSHVSSSYAVFCLTKKTEP